MKKKLETVVENPALLMLVLVGAFTVLAAVFAAFVPPAA